MFFECRCAVCDSAPGPVCDGCASRLLSGPCNGDVRARFVLDDAARSIVAALKYRRERRLARWAAAAMAPLVPALADVVTWVPATPERVAWRGYDQSGEIARELASHLHLPARPLLTRDRKDQRQTSRSRAERAQGPQLQAPVQIKGVVVVIDDVTTTGSTLATTARLLAEAGADRVVSVVLAAAPLRNRPVAVATQLRPGASSL